MHVANAYTPTGSIVGRPFLTFATSLAPGKCARGVPAPSVLDGAPWLLAHPARDLDLIALMLILKHPSAPVEGDTEKHHGGSRLAGRAAGPGLDKPARCCA